MRNRWAGVPFTDADDDIAAALLDLSIPTLMLSLVHITGDIELLRDRLRPNGVFLNEVQGFMSPEDQAAVRELALPILRDYRDRGCPEPAPLSGEVITEMMRWLVCEEVPEEYLPMVLADLELDGTDPDEAVRESDHSDRDDFNVVVIGCGQSGLLAGIRLQQMGIPYIIIEKNSGVGGTWWENSYPGARVDVGNHFYCYSAEPSYDWSEYFAQQPELQGYFQRVMDEHDIAPHVRFGTEVLGARWDEQHQRWLVTILPADGPAEIVECSAIISAVGQLNRPKIPELEGRDRFAGPAFHSARWDHDLDLTGKQVAMIGAGASGFQIAPAIAEQVKSLSIFQRTAQWMFPNPNYHAAVGQGVRWALTHLPFYGRWYRFLLFWPGCEKGREAALVDPDYTGDPAEAVSEINNAARLMFTHWISSQINDDPDLLAKVMPDYPATGKRTLQDNGSWLRTLQRDNVELIREGIHHIEADGVVAEDGKRYPADVIIYATGFHANRALWPMEITGRDGLELQQLWGERPSAYLGITVPGFPNLFCMYGPGTNLAHGGSLILHSECQMRYISSALEQLIDSGHRSMDPLQSRCEDWHARSQAELARLVWTQPSVKHSFYKNSHGEIHSLSPWRLVDYWTWTKHADLTDYVLR
ncbi:flavin-containing monooxygenase [Nocardia neocaledoniensis]|uniref:flavin-containing monooxygenase n=1 Tax=Nocardia neocaledoniensis TaxID=236511 RepID=UPI002458AD2A|nr:NAD(P)/FAD-dependent oxidoreductase [Nocardia neocaledoniensis]